MFYASMAIYRDHCACVSLQNVAKVPTEIYVAVNVETVQTVDAMGIQGCVKVAAISVGKERNVIQYVIQIVWTLNATKIRDFAQLDAAQVGLETHVVGGVLQSAKRRVIELQAVQVARQAITDLIVINVTGMFMEKTAA